MKILLIEDVDNLGYAGDFKKVAAGFGRNYLLPQKLAILATEGAIKQASTIRNAAEKRRARDTDDAKAIANQLGKLSLVFERRSGETGKLYGSVTSAEIAEAIKNKSEIEVDKRKIVLHEPIRQLGKHEITVKVMVDVSTMVNVEVLPEGGIMERQRAATKAKQIAEKAAQAETEAAESKVKAESAKAKASEAAVDSLVGSFLEQTVAA